MSVCSEVSDAVDETFSSIGSRHYRYIILENCRLSCHWRSADLSNNAFYSIFHIIQILKSRTYSTTSSLTMTTFTRFDLSSVGLQCPLAAFVQCQSTYHVLYKMHPQKSQCVSSTTPSASQSSFYHSFWHDEGIPPPPSPTYTIPYEVDLSLPQIDLLLPTTVSRGPSTPYPQISIKQRLVQQTWNLG